MTRLSLCLCVSVVTLASFAQAQLPVQIETRRAGWVGVSTPAASNAPFHQGFPIPDAAGVRCGDDQHACAVGDQDPNLRLENLGGARQPSQFRVLGLWPSGNVEWVSLNGQTSFSAGGVDYGLKLVQSTAAGSYGSYGGNDLAVAGQKCDGTADAQYICVDTGAAKFQLKAANFRLFDDVQVGATHVVLSSRIANNDGLRVLGPAATGPAAPMPAAVSCATLADCTTVYSSQNDPYATAVVEANGPLRAVVKIQGDLRDASGQIYLGFTARMKFHKGQAWVNPEISLRNANCSSTIDPNTHTWSRAACNAALSGDFTNAAKQFRSFEAILTDNLSGNRTVTLAGAAGNVTATLSTGNYAYLYQGWSDWGQNMFWPASSPCTGLSDICVRSFITRSSGTVYAQNGWTMQSDVALSGSPTSGNQASYVAGWADSQTTGGAGIQAGVRFLSGYWPKSLEYRNGGSEVRIGIWPDQNLWPDASCGAPAPCKIPYQIEWTHYQTHDLFFGFHASALSSQSDNFKGFDHPVVARAAPGGNGLLAYQYYNSAKDNRGCVGGTGIDCAGGTSYPATYALGLKMPDPVAEDNYYKSISHPQCGAGQTAGACLQDVGGTAQPANPLIQRMKNWPSAAPDNDHDFVWSNMLVYLQRGLPGRWVVAQNFARMVNEHSYPRSDFDGGYRNDYFCTPTGTPSHCTNENSLGYPKNYTSVNGRMRNWQNDDTHQMYYSHPLYYFLSGGDQQSREQLSQGFKDLFLNTRVYGVNPGAFSPPQWINVSRSVGHYLNTNAWYALYLNAVGDADAAGALTLGDNLIGYVFRPDLWASGYGDPPCGNSSCTNGASCWINGGVYVKKGWYCPKGVSRVRGLFFGGGEQSDALQDPWFAAGTCPHDGVSTYAPKCPVPTDQAHSYANGTVNISGGVNVAWATGAHSFGGVQADRFPSFLAGRSITLANIAYQVASVTDSTHLVLQAPGAPDGTGVAFKWSTWAMPENAVVPLDESVNVRWVKSFMTGILTSGVQQYNLAARSIRGNKWTANTGNGSISDLLVRSLLYGIANGTQRENFVAGNDHAGPYDAAHGINFPGSDPGAADAHYSGWKYFSGPDFRNHNANCPVGWGAGSASNTIVPFHTLCSNSCTWGPSSGRSYEAGTCGSDFSWPIFGSIEAITGSASNMAGENWIANFDLAAGNSFFGDGSAFGLVGNWGSWDAWYSLNPVIDLKAAPSSAQLKSVTLSGDVSCSGKTSCTVSWSAPGDVTTKGGLAYWMKYTDNGKQIVDDLFFYNDGQVGNQPAWERACTVNAPVDTYTGMNISTGCFVYDPASYVNWWAAKDVSSEPAATATTFTLSGLDPAKTYRFSLKYYSGTPPAAHSLTVTAPTHGNITSAPVGINCGSGGSNCTGSFSGSVTLYAAADAGYEFTYWTGDCSTQVPAVCPLTMDADKTAGALFAAPSTYRLTAAVISSGSVTSSEGGISCPGTCAADITAGHTVTLTAVPAQGYRLKLWTGDCSGSGSCSVTMDADRNVTAEFEAIPPSGQAQGRFSGKRVKGAVIR